jgi:AraC-like DNA-binding protein
MRFGLTVFQHGIDPTGQIIRPAQPHTHIFHEFLAVQSGRAQQSTPAGLVPCAPGDVFLFPAGIPHISQVGSERLQILVVYAGDDCFVGGGADHEATVLIERIAAAAGPTCRLPVSADGAAAFHQAMRSIHRELTEQRPGARAMAKAHLATALAQVVRDPRFPSRCIPHLRGDSAEGIEAAVNFLDNNWMLPMSISELASITGVGRSRFHELFRQNTGGTVHDRLAQHRLTEAKRLLTIGELSTLEIALRCGYGSASHFCHCFKDATGMNPGAWRKQAG